MPALRVGDEARELPEVQSQPGLHSEFEVSLATSVSKTKPKQIPYPSSTFKTMII